MISYGDGKFIGFLSYIRINIAIGCWEGSELGLECRLGNGFSRFSECRVRSYFYFYVTSIFGY